MTSDVLLLGNDKNHGLKLAQLLIHLGLKPAVANWHDFSPRNYSWFRRPKLIIANTDHPSAPPFDAFSTLVRKHWGQNFPIIALANSKKFDHVANLIDAGADACLPPNEQQTVLERKITACLENKPATTTTDLADEVPNSLTAPFSQNNSLVPLGSLVSVHTGAAPRSAWGRRTAPPDDAWHKVITADTIEQFHISKPTTYLLWSKLRLFRVPTLAEYSVPEKVVLSRVGPPINAAVDRSRTPTAADVYSLVPKEDSGANAAYVACLLNSRLLDFYFNRLAPASDGRLRPEIIKNTPVPTPRPAQNREFERYATLLSHFGPNPKDWIDRQSMNETREAMDNAVFSLYGVESGAREELAGLHF